MNKKADRASLVGYAIEYINELKRTVEKLKVLVEKKRCSRSRIKRRKNEDDSTLDVESIYTRNNGDHQQVINGDSSSTMRSSWLQKKSKNTEIDVRIIDDEVTIKLVHAKKMNCLLIVSKVLDEFQLDLHHVAGGVIGDFYSYLFNSKVQVVEQMPCNFELYICYHPLGEFCGYFKFEIIWLILETLFNDLE